MCGITIHIDLDLYTYKTKEEFYFQFFHTPIHPLAAISFSHFTCSSTLIFFPFLFFICNYSNM